MYSILDVETTGGKFNEEGITEIAIYRFDGEKIVDQFVSLINPEIPIQPFVQQLTGINDKMLINAPKFYQIAKRIITLKFISLVNLIMDREVVTELIQNDFTKENLKRELSKILDKEHREKLFLSYFELEEKLGGKGASEKTAKLIIKNLKA